MDNYINTLHRIDMVTDCIPVISTVKNIPIVLYQIAHKVNRTANPVTNTIKDDIKIIALSKNTRLALFASVPIIGNLSAFVTHALLTVISYIGQHVVPDRSRVSDVICSSSYGVSKHKIEIVKLLLGRNPNLKTGALELAAFNAARKDEAEIFKLIYNSSKTWSKEVEEEIHNITTSKEILSFLVMKDNESLV